MKRLTSAIAAFHARFVKAVPRTDPDYDDGPLTSTRWPASRGCSTTRA